MSLYIKKCFYVSLGYQFKITFYEVQSDTFLKFWLINQEYNFEQKLYRIYLFVNILQVFDEFLTDKVADFKAFNPFSFFLFP